MAVENGDTIFQTLLETITRQQELITSIATKLQKLESIGGGGGTATIADYTSHTSYKRNTLVVDVGTETVYRVLNDYTSNTVEQDCQAGNLKLVGFESQIVTLGSKPTQQQINVLPEDTLVAIYNAADPPYEP
jgi:hypothetical protein